MNPRPVILDAARYRKLIDMLRIAYDALRQARFFHCGPSDSFRIVHALDQTIKHEQENRP